jgi:hypothetical protein
MVGDMGGEACTAASASTGAEAFRDWFGVTAAFFASSLSASRVTALLNSSIAGDVGAFFAGFGARTRSTCTALVVVETCSWLCTGRGQEVPGVPGLRSPLLASDTDLAVVDSCSGLGTGRLPFRLLPTVDVVVVYGRSSCKPITGADQPG